MIWRAILGTILFTLLVPGTVIALAPYLLLTLDIRHYPLQLGVLRYLGYPALVVGGLVYCWTAWDFIYHGRGTPAPVAAPDRLVVQGLYRYVRNPMYLGVLLILLGEAFLYQELVLFAYTLMVLYSFNRFVVGYEEPILKRKFSAAYQLYCRVVPRWIPRLR